MKQLFTETQIATMVSNLTDDLNRDYDNKKPIIIGVLNGSFIFLADLVRKLNFDFQIDFCQVRSYKDNERGQLEFLKEQLEICGPSSIKVCALLLRKKQFSRDNSLGADYYGFMLDDEFVYGYGLDNAQYKRGLKNIYKI